MQLINYNPERVINCHKKSEEGLNGETCFMCLQNTDQNPQVFIKIVVIPPSNGLSFDALFPRVYYGYSSSESGYDTP